MDRDTKNIIIASNQNKKDEEYWQNELSGHFTKSHISYDVLNPDSKLMEASVSQLLPEILGRKLLKLAANSDEALYIIFLAGIYTLVNHLAGTEDITVGIPDYKANGKKEIINYGYPLRFNVDSSTSYKDLLIALRDKYINTYKFTDYLIELIANKLDVTLKEEENPFFDILVLMENIHEDYSLSDAKCNLKIKILKNQDSLSLSVEYNANLYFKGTIEKIASLSVFILSQVIDNVNLDISSIELLTTDEKRKLSEILHDTAVAYPKEKTIVELIEDQAEINPDHVALASGNEQITYKQLFHASEKIAGFIHRRSKNKNQIIGIMMDRTCEMVMAILGILKAGCSFLPIDPGYPRRRKEYIMKDSGVNLLIVSSDVALEIETPGCSIINVEEIINEENRQTKIEFANRGNDIAYIIYTSGSSGNPKGVLIENSSLVNYLWWASTQYSKNIECDFPLYTSISFDLTITSIFLPLLNKGRLIIYKESNKSFAINQVIKDNKVSIIKITPSHLRLILEDKGLSVEKSLLKRFIVGGEELTSDLAGHIFEKFGGTIEIFNEYGPTEATVGCMIAKYDPANNKYKSVPIGIPADNVKIYLFDPRLKFTPFGGYGEIYIAGEGLARGYLNNPELTYERFMVIPEQNTRFYKTGDIARLLNDGSLEFKGRLDSQIKIMGHRIEISEIEFHLCTYSDIQSVVVVPIKPGDGQQVLCAYFISENKIDTEKLRGFLAERLPIWMLPHYFIRLSELPLTSNGKLDTRLLPDPVESDVTSGTNYLGPQNETENMLVDIWGKVLKISNIGIHDNFFIIGGDSIKSIQIQARLKSYGYTVEINDIFRYPTISQLSEKIIKLTSIPNQGIVAGNIELTPIQKKFFDSDFVHQDHYNQSVMLYFAEDLNYNDVTIVFHKILEHHDVLRARYEFKNNDVTQVISDLPLPLKIREFNIKGKRSDKDLMTKLANELQADISLEEAPLMRLGLFHIDSGGASLLIIVHHLLVDGVSWRILLEDLGILFDQLRQNEPLNLPYKSGSYQEWAKSLKQYANSGQLLKEKSYWASIESQFCPTIYVEKKSPEIKVEDLHVSDFKLEEDDSRYLLSEIHKAYGTAINDILLLGLYRSMKKIFNVNKFLIDIEGHGREEINDRIDISRTVGWFTSVYPLIIKLSDDSDLALQIKEIKECIRKIPNKGIGYGILKYLTDNANKDDIIFKSKPEIVFNYLGQFNDITADTPFVISNENKGESMNIGEKCEYKFIFSGMFVSDCLHISVKYNQKQYSNELIGELLQCYHNTLLEVIDHCKKRNEITYTPSDFIYKGLTIPKVDELCAKFPVEDIYMLNPMQEGMLFHSLAQKGSLSYFEQIAYRVEGLLDEKIVKESLHVISERHEILRSAFVYNNQERPLQIILKDRGISFKFKDISHLSPQEKDLFVSSYKAEDKSRPFDLEEGNLMRASLLKLEDNLYEFIWDFHHIIMDGWCIAIVSNDFFEIYTSIAEKRPANLQAIKPYKLYKEWLGNQDKKEAIKYWGKYLNGYVTHVDIPSSVPAKKDNKYLNGQYAFNLAHEQTSRLKEIAARNNVTLNTLIQVAWGIVLGNYNDSNDVVFGSVVSGRPHIIEGIEGMVGLFINTIPVRIKYNSATKIGDLIKQVQDDSISGNGYHYVSLAEIQALSQMKQDLINNILVFENLPVNESMSSSAGAGYPFKFTRIDSFEQTNYDFNLMIVPKEELLFRIVYNKNRFDSESVKYIGEHILQVLYEIIQNESIYVKDISILTKAEEDKVLFEFNHPDRQNQDGADLLQLFEKQVELHGEKTALVFPVDFENIYIKYGVAPESEDCQLVYEKLSFSELNRKANQVAYYLVDKGISNNHIVGLLFEPSFEMMISILGVLKARAAFLPINPEFPKERIDYMIRDCKCKVVISGSGKYSSFADCQLVRVEDILKENLPDKNLSVNGSPDDIVYAIYTSGTSGKPKGVLVRHRGLLNYVNWFRDKIGLTAEDKTVLTSSYSFDLGFSSLFPCLLSGGGLYLPTKDIYMSPEKLIKLIADSDISYLKLTPGFFSTIVQSSYFKPDQFEKLRYIFLGGEPINVEDVRQVYDKCPSVRVINHYGPTEATIGCITKYIPKESVDDYELNPTIGAPIENMKAFIANANGKIQPVNVSGDLYLSGEGLALGYLNNPEQTYLKFNNKNISPLPVYSTGDRAMWLSNGEIKFLGRNDNQIKIRGYRVELGEIRNELLKNQDIQDAFVVGKTSEDGNKYLSVYYTRKELEPGPYFSIVDDMDKFGYREIFEILQSNDKVLFQSGGKDFYKSALLSGAWQLSTEIQKRYNDTYALSKSEITRYKRQLLIKDWGIGAQEILKSKTVFVAGAGGGASPTIMQLALLGVGTIKICDFDVVELSNLNRQFLHDESRIGMSKAESAKITVERINPHVHVVPVMHKITAENVGDIIGDADIIFDMLDGISDKFIISSYATMKQIPHIVSAMTDINGYSAIFHSPYTPCFHCVFSKEKLDALEEGMKSHDDTYRKNPLAVIAPSLFMSTGFSVNEAIKYLLGFGNLVYNKFIYFNSRGTPELAISPSYQSMTYAFSEHFLEECKSQGFDWGIGWRGNFIEELNITKDHACVNCNAAKEYPAASVEEQTSDEKNNLEKAKQILVPNSSNNEEETRQQKVALLLGYNIHFVISLLAAWNSNKSVVIIPPGLDEYDKINLVKSSNVRVILTDKKNYNYSVSLTDKCNKNIEIIDVEENISSDKHVESFDKPECFASAVFDYVFDGQGGLEEKVYSFHEILTSGFNGGTETGSPGLEIISNILKSVIRNKTYVFTEENNHAQFHEKLKSFLRCNLPEYMIPAEFIAVKDFPLTANGKVDSKALERINTTKDKALAVDRPSNAIEKLLVSVWKEVLVRENIGINDNFFAIGGDSIKAIRICSQLRGKGYYLEIGDLLKEPVIKKLQHYVRNAETTTSQLPSGDGGFTYQKLQDDQLNEILKNYNVEDIYPLTPIQEAMLYHSVCNASSTANFQQFSFKIYGDLRIELVMETLKTLFSRHDILRTAFIYKNLDEPLQVVVKDRIPELKYMDIRGEFEPENIIGNYKTKDLNNLFNLEKDVLLRIAIFQLSDDVFEFIWSSHHILLDGWCRQIFISEYGLVYQALSDQQQPEMPETIPYKTFIRWMENQDMAQSYGYWQNYLSSYKNITRIQINKKTEKADYLAKQHTLTIDRETAQKLAEISVKNNTTMNTLFKALWSLLLAKYNNQNDVVFGTVVSGRPPEIPGVDTILGMFINIVPLRVEINESYSFNRLLRDIQQDFIGSTKYQYTPLAEIQRVSGAAGTLFDHIFIFQNYAGQTNITTEMDKPDILYEQIDTFGRTNYDFNVFVLPGKNIDVIFRYNGNIFSGNFVEDIATDLITLVRQIIEEPEKVIGLPNNDKGEKSSMDKKIEMELKKYPGISDIVVSRSATNKVTAYICEDGTVSTLRLRKHLKALLHVTDEIDFIQLDTIPYSSNGKSDINLFKDPDTSVPDNIRSSDMELKMSKIWQEVLQVDKLSLHDTFVESGGNSFLVAKLITRLRQEFGVEPDFVDFFNQSLRQFTSNFEVKLNSVPSF